MKTSVIMATLNAGPYLQQALDSIARQTRPVHEVILVDGGSADGTREIAADYPFVRIIGQSGKGLPNAWNCGIAEARGQFIAFLDSDDTWTHEKTERQLQAFESDPTLQAVIGHVRFFLEPGIPCPPHFKPELLQGIHAAPMPGALLIRRSALDGVGLFDTRFTIACDIDWFARLRDLEIKTETLPDLLINKRVHQHNLSLTPARQASYQRELALLLFEKRRRQSSKSHVRESGES